MFPMTMTISNATQLNAVLAALSIDANPVQATVTHNGASNTPSSSPATPAADVAAPETASTPASPAIVDAASATEKKDVQKAEAVTPQPTATVEGAAAAVEQKGAPSVAFDAVKIPFLALVNSNRESALAILKKFGLAKLSEAKPEQYGELFAAVQGA